MTGSDSVNVEMLRCWTELPNDSCYIPQMNLRTENTQADSYHPVLTIARIHAFMQ